MDGGQVLLMDDGLVLLATAGCVPMRLGRRRAAPVGRCPSAAMGHKVAPAGVRRQAHSSRRHMVAAGPAVADHLPCAGRQPGRA